MSLWLFRYHNLSLDLQIKILSSCFGNYIKQVTIEMIRFYDTQIT